MAVADAYVAELDKARAILDRPTMKIREEILVSYPFHFSTKHLIASFNDNPGFQKTRDVIRLMATIVRGLWSKGETEVAQALLLSLETADLNDPIVASRFIEIKKSLQDALQTDIANNGTSHAESLDAETDDLAGRCAKWIYCGVAFRGASAGLTDPSLPSTAGAGPSIVGLPMRSRNSTTPAGTSSRPSRGDISSIATKTSTPRSTATSMAAPTSTGMRRSRQS